MRAGMVLAGLLLTIGSMAAMKAVAGARWGYEDTNGPALWGNLSPDWALCASGRNQSPVDIRDTIDADLTALSFYPEIAVRRMPSDGETEMRAVDRRAVLRIDDADFAFVRMHLHAPAEHRIDGRPFPLEAHFLHVSEAGDLAVVAVVFETGAVNRALAQLGYEEGDLAAGPEQAIDHAPAVVTLATANLFPTDRDYFRFSGSLTTPPCTEGVRWLVLKTPAEASAAQIRAVVAKIGAANNRPTQPHNGRPILR